MRLAAVAELARADGQDPAALRLLLGRVGQQDAAGRLLFRFQRLDHARGHPGVEFAIFLLHDSGQLSVISIQPTDGA